MRFSTWSQLEQHLTEWMRDVSWSDAGQRLHLEVESLNLCESERVAVGSHVRSLKSEVRVKVKFRVKIRLNFNHILFCHKTTLNDVTCSVVVYSTAVKRRKVIS